MKVIVLLENTTILPEYKSEHGLSLYIETKNHKILFDLGGSKLFIHNAEIAGVDISNVDTVVISHGHSDHGGALKWFLEKNKTAKVYVQERAFDNHYTKICGIPWYVGLNRSLKNNEQIVFVKDLLNIDNELLLFSNVEGKDFKAESNKSLYIKKDGKIEQDDFEHELNLIIKENNNSVLVAGCAHNGIVNIKNEAENILNKELSHLISGFHLFNPVSKNIESKELVLDIGEELAKYDTICYTGHCTGKKAYDILKTIMDDKINYISTGQQMFI